MSSYSVQTNSFCNDLQLPISDHICLNTKFSMGVVTSCGMYSYTDSSFFFPLDFSPVCMDFTDWYSEAFCPFSDSPLPMMHGLSGYCTEVSGRCTGSFLKSIPCVRGTDMKQCVFQHLIADLIQFQCSAVRSSVITFIWSVYRKMGTSASMCRYSLGAAALRAE